MTARGQGSTLFPSGWKDICTRITGRAIDVFVSLSLILGQARLFGGVERRRQGGRLPSEDAAEEYVSGYLNRVKSRPEPMERECQRHIEVVWLTGRPDAGLHAIADCRKDNGEAIRKVMP